jgi:HK97 family phage portal protein
MSIYSFLRDLVARKSTADLVAPGGWQIIGGSQDGIHERNLLAANREWVYIAVDKVALGVASIRFKVMRYQRNGDDQEVFDGPLVRFLENPSPLLTGKDFIYLNTVYKELTGNAFWERVKGSQVVPLIPTQVAPVVDNGRLLKYRYTSETGQRFLDLEDVLHDRYIDPARPYWGAGKLQKIARWVDTSYFANEFLRRFFLNGATFGGFIETEEESQERIDLIKSGLVSEHVGVQNAHKIGILPKGAKYTKVTANMNEIELGATDDRYRDKILAGFGVPKTLVGLTNEVNRATAEAAEYVFAQYTLKPLADDLVEFLNTNVAAALDTSGKYYFAYDEFVPANREIQIKEREIALNRQPYKTVNEVRAEVGLPPVTGGDVIYGNPFQAPLGSPVASPNLPPGSAEDDEVDQDTPPPAKARSRAIPARVRTTASREDALDSVVKRIASKFREIATDRDVKDAADHKEFVGRVEQHSDYLADRVREFNNRQQRQVLVDLGSITKAVAKGDLWDPKAETAIMVDMVTPLLRGLLTEQALAEYAAQGFAGTFDSGSELVRKTLDLAAKRLATSYNDTTANLLKAALNEGISAGEGLAELTKRVQQVYEFSDLVRAKAVAHTESFYIANEANKLAYKQSSVVSSMRWYTGEDEMVCPHCASMQGRSVGVDEVFAKKGEVLQGSDGSALRLDYRAIDVPPLHTNCRCFIRPDGIAIGD